jgi:hypothetical protein
MKHGHRRPVAGRRILTILAALAIAFALTATSAHAGDLERHTRRDAGIPAHAVTRVPAYDTFTQGTQFRPEGTHCFTSRTIRRVHVQGKLVRKGRLLQYCTDKYVDERRAARTFVRYLRFATLNAAETADRERQRLACIDAGGVFDFAGRYLCTLPDGTNGLPNG